uniref:Si:ch211-212d10.1 n=1 Tax=Cyprinus carpio TaxID=7962 RepID=A0A8C2I567_CYPCA
MHDGIVGGKASVLHSRPYMVYIRDKVLKSTCGGFLVREDYVMTAAHCKRRYVKLSCHSFIRKVPMLQDVIQLSSSSTENKTLHLLIQLKTPATSKKIAVTITLPNPENEEISKDCMVMGWGWKNYHDKSPSNVLQEANVTLIDSENCGTADILCTEGSTGPALVFQGDSGGPLVCGGVAQGIVSFSKNKTNANYLAGYTRISHYLPWIQSIMMSPTTQPFKGAPF